MSSDPIRVPVSRGRDQGGFALPMVMAFMLLATAVALSALSYARSSMEAGNEAVAVNRQRSVERDALEYVLAVVRDDMSKGVAGQTEAATVAGVRAECVGQPGSGQTSGTGRTDRTVKCTTPSMTLLVRFFDRGGARAGVVEEVLRRDIG